MKIDKLFKHYDGLETHERLALVCAADARGDKEEYGRLVRTAPRWVLQAPDIYLSAQSLEHVTHLYIMQQQELLALYVLAEREFSEPEFEGENVDQHLKAIARLAAVFTANQMAWRLFCTRISVDSARSLRDLPGAALVERYIPAMEVMSSLANDDNLLSDEQIRDTADAIYTAWEKWSET